MILKVKMIYIIMTMKTSSYEFIYIYKYVVQSYVVEQPSRQFLRSLDVQARIQTANTDPSSPAKVSPVASQKPSFLTCWVD